MATIYPGGEKQLLVKELRGTGFVCRITVTPSEMYFALH